MYRFTLVPMAPKIERRLEDLQRRLMAARESLAVLQEQVQVWNDALEDARKLRNTYAAALAPAPGPPPLTPRAHSSGTAFLSKC